MGEKHGKVSTNVGSWTLTFTESPISRFIDMTIHYVGVDSDEMAAGLERLEKAMRESLTVPRL